MKSIVFICFFTITISTFSQDLQKTITVRGEYTEEISPDEIEFTFDLIQTEKLKKESDIEYKELKLKNVLKNYNIPKDKWVINKLVSSNYQFYFSTGKYNSFRSYSLKLKNDSNLTNILYQLYEIGFNDIRLNKVISNHINEIKESLSIKAFDIAKSKAQKLTKHMNKELGDVLIAREVNPDYIYKTTSYRDKYETPLFGNVRGSNKINSSLQKIKLIYSIDVTFEIK